MPRKQPKPTKPNFPADPRYDFENLDAKYQTAIEARLSGLKYKDIAKSCHVTESTVKGWFFKGGILFVAYGQKLKERKAENRKLFKGWPDDLKDMALDAKVVVQKAVRNGDVKTAIEVMKMAGMEEPTKVQHSNDPNNPIIAPVIITLPDNDRNQPTN